ncbi:MAG TPA: isochorismate synthase, partial [Dehalococcoidia bacterium]
RLVEGYPHCTVFAFARGDSCFLGATPERLVRVDRPALDGRDAPSMVRADCLAGSARRGATEEEDWRLGESLRADPKELHEHAVVVQALRDGLEPLCSRLDIPEAPGLLRLPNVQHLHTPIEGVLSTERGVLELVERLHPTPAAGGLPRDAALPLIRQLESFDRGWYAGPVGWVDGRGDGEFAVAIRSALIRRQEAFLYAGCGIVAGSDPEREYSESCLKLRPMLWALNGNAT